METVSDAPSAPVQTRAAESHERIDYSGLALVIFNGVLAYSTTLLWMSTRRLWRGAEEQARHIAASADASVRSASAAAMSVEAYGRAERAWLGYDRIDSFNYSGSDARGIPVKNSIFLVVNMINSGRTPAMRVDTETKLALVPRSYAGSPIFQAKSIWDDNISGSFVVPNGKLTTPPMALSDEEFAEFRARKTKIIVWCRSTYSDVLGDDAVRVSEMCMVGIYNGDEMNSVTKAVTTHIVWTPVGPQNLAT